MPASNQATPARKPDADAYSDNPSVPQVDAERWPPDSLPPDVAAYLEDVERRHRENYAFTLVYRIRNEHDYSAWPSPNEVALRLNGKFPGGIQLHLPLDAGA